MINQKYLDKAEILIEALPYIQRFSKKVIVIKYGGSAMMDENLKMNVIEDAVLLKLVGFKPVIVHGGGIEISRWTEKLGMENEFVDGFRKTDADMMELVEMVLTKVNKDLVAKVQSLGVKAAGISGKDGGLLKVEKKYADGKDIGYVGEITGVDISIVEDLLDDDFLPIISPIGMDDNFETYNIKADEAASAVAKALGAEKLAFLSEIDGVRKNIEDPESVYAEIYAHELVELIEKGKTAEKNNLMFGNCIDAIESGVSRVHVIDGSIPHSLLLEIFTDKGTGTAIMSDKEDKYWNE